MSRKQIKKHITQYLRCATYHMGIFNMTSVGTCKCDCMPFPSWSGLFNFNLSHTNICSILIFLTLIYTHMEKMKLTCMRTCKYKTKLRN